ncbi:MAG: hypothetical protein ACQCN3_07955 [Candidatus Bathyarchaeia archaeon]|jgi:hypothetical protein
MDAKNIALCSLFVAVAIVLGRFSVNIGAGISFYFWEIPVVVALLLYGFKMGFSVAAISIFGQAIFFPKAIGIFFPIWNLIAMTTTIVGIALTLWLITRKISNGSKTGKTGVKLLILLVSSAIGVRLAIMPFVNFFMYKYMLAFVIGKVYSDVYVMALIPFLMVYDAVLVFYSVTIGYIIAKRANRDLKIGNTFL